MCAQALGSFFSVKRVTRTCEEYVREEGGKGDWMRRRYIVLTKECVRKKKKSTIGTIYSSEHFWRVLVLQERLSTKQYCSVVSVHVIQYGTRVATVLISFLQVLHCMEQL